MSATLLDGRELAAEIRKQVREDAAALRAAGHVPALSAVLVGDSEAALLYAKSQQRRCEKVGIAYRLIQLAADTEVAVIAAEIDRLNADDTVTGIVLLTPLPPHIPAHEIQYRIDPYKDVEGVNPANIGLCFYGSPIIAPCTSLAVMEMLRLAGCKVEGAHAVVVGQSAIVGRPITMFLLQQHATVAACHKYTQSLADETRRADVLVVAVGKAGLITADMVKPGAVVIDVGINTVAEQSGDGAVSERVVGDVCFDEVAEIAGAITPVPGGIGPVTVALLLRNTIESVRKQRIRR